MRQNATNSFEGGLNLDLHPIVTPNSVLTDNLNGTFITYNGNEFCLQNDRGNIAKATLTEGFIPVGVKEFNGVMYIASVHPIYEDGEVVDNFFELGTYPGVDWSKVSENEKVFELDYNAYTPFKNFLSGDDRITFQTNALGYDLNHPVQIDIQSSYDGSVNLILVDGKNPVRMVNSGFSVLPNAKYKFIDRNQSVDTNVYDIAKLEEQLSLIRITNNTITNVESISVVSGGQFKGGNYTFYIKFGDADYNQTDVVAESGIVSIFNGNDGVPSTISGTLLDERTDKMIQLKITGLNASYSKIYIYYTREYSDTLGFRMSECGMFSKPIDMDPKKDSKWNLYQEIWLTGYEAQESVNVEELNVDYHTVDFAKAEAQQANMLFLGNIGQDETFELYQKLRELTLGVTAKVYQSTSLDPVSHDFKSGKDYYSTTNIYEKLGYWPEEFYRFGIVYILKDGSTTPVFNMQGGEFKTVGEELSNFNDFGVFLTPRADILSESKPLYFKFTLPDLSDDLKEKISGWFVVRQKRIPTTICQGILMGIDKRTHLPVTWNGGRWMTQSFLALDRNGATKTNPDTGETYKEGLAPSTHKYYPRLEYNVVSKSKSTEYIYNGFYVCVSDPEKVLFTYDDKFKEDRIPLKSLQSNNYQAYINDAEITTEVQQNWGYDSRYKDLFEQNHEICVWKVTFKYKIDSTEERQTYQELNPEITIYFVSDDPNTFSGEMVIHGIYGGQIESGDAIRIQESLLSEYVTKTIDHGADNQDKFIAYTYSKQSDYLSGKGLLSLDPAVNSTVGSMIDGSEFIVSKEYTTTTKFGAKNNDYLKVTNQNGTFYRIDEEINSYLNTSSEKSVKSVYVSPNTAVKVVDEYAFSNVAGSAASASDFKRAAQSLGIYVDADSKRYKLQKDLLKSLTEFEVGTDDYHGFNSTHNVNLIRGLFTPYVGLATNDLETGLYSIRHKLDSYNTSVTVRQNDESSYYAVSFRESVNQRQISVFRGDCYICTVAMRIITNFIDDTAPVSDTIVDPASWERFVRQRSLYGGDKTGEDAKANIVTYSEVNLSDVNTVDLGYWVTFKCLSSYNLGLRSLDTSHTDEMALMGSPRSFYPLNGGSTATGNKMQESFILNDGLSATVGEKRYDLLQDTPYTKSEFSNRIIFSNINVTDAFTNGYRTFQGLSFKDYDKQYGEITKLVPWGNNIFIVMEHGLGMIPVNEKALMQTTTGEAIHIYGYGVLPDQMSIISQDFGSKYEQSVIKTPIGIYGIDTDARKIWRFSDSKGFETLSDMKIETYLNDNLFTDEEIEIGKCDIRSHYNSLKGDVMFSFYNNMDMSKVDHTHYLFVKNQSVTVDVDETKSVKFYSCSDVTIDFDSEYVDATVNEDFVVIKGVKKTTRTVISITNSDGLSNLIVVKVDAVSSEEPETPDTSDDDLFINLSGSTFNMYPGQSRSLKITTNHPDVTPEMLKVKVIGGAGIVRTSIASGNLIVTALKAGNIGVYVQYGDTTSSTVNVNVAEKKKSLWFDPSVIEIPYGETATVKCMDYVGDLSYYVTDYRDDEDYTLAKVTLDGDVFTIEPKKHYNNQIRVHVSDSEGTIGEFYIYITWETWANGLNWREDNSTNFEDDGETVTIKMKVGDPMAYYYFNLTVDGEELDYINKVSYGYSHRGGDGNLTTDGLDRAAKCIFMRPRYAGYKEIFFELDVATDYGYERVWSRLIKVIVEDE